MNPTTTLGRVVRSLRRSPGFVAIATLSMGIALGISTSVFAVMDAMTHPEPPFRDVDQLVDVQFSVRLTTAPPVAEILRNVLAMPVVDRVAQWSVGSDGGIAMLGERLGSLSSTRRAGPGFFDVLGAKARLGRLFTAADHEAGNVVVVTDLVWRRDYRNAPKLDSAKVQIGDRVFPIVGVLPPGTNRSLRGDVFIADSTRTGQLTGLVIRMKPGVTVAEFQTQLNALDERLTKAYAVGKDRGVSAYIATLRPDPLAVRDFHRAMVGAALCILLIACANVSALALARGMVKRRDYALRLALGAHPVELVREVVAEIGMLAVAGCVAGAFVTSWFVGVIGRSMPPEMQWEGFVQPQWSWRVFALAFVAVVASIGIAGGAPAWMAARTDPAGPLKEGSGGTTGRAGTRFRWLVMAELAIAMTLLMSTSLMLKSIRMMERYDFGYPNDRLLNVMVASPWRQDSTTLEDEAQRRQQGLEILRAVPGVQAAVSATRGWCGTQAHTVSTDEGRSLSLVANTARAGGCVGTGPGFMSTVGLTMLQGRDFAEGDLAGNGAAILDENLTRALFGDASPVGHSLKLGDPRSTAPWLTIVGVVKNHMLDFDRNPELGVNTAPMVYVVTPPRPSTNRAGQPRGTKNLAYTIRTDGNVDAVKFRVQQALAALTPTRGAAGVMPWSQNFQSQLRAEQFLALIFTLLGLASLLLGAAGLFSVISYIAGQRMREFAVRIALGATTDNVIKLVMREAFTMAIGGTAAGAGLGMWAAFLLWERMWGIYPVDVEALVIAEVTLILVTMAACIVPALRASKSNPLEIIRAA